MEVDEIPSTFSSFDYFCALVFVYNARAPPPRLSKSMLALVWYYQARAARTTLIASNRGNGHLMVTLMQDGEAHDDKAFKAFDELWYFQRWTGHHYFIDLGARVVGVTRAHSNLVMRLDTRTMEWINPLFMTHNINNVLAIFQWQEEDPDAFYVMQPLPRGNDAEVYRIERRTFAPVGRWVLRLPTTYELQFVKLEYKRVLIHGKVIGASVVSGWIWDFEKMTAAIWNDKVIANAHVCWKGGNEVTIFGWDFMDEKHVAVHHVFCDAQCEAVAAVERLGRGKLCGAVMHGRDDVDLLFWHDHEGEIEHFGDPDGRKKAPFCADGCTAIPYYQ